MENEMNPEFAALLEKANAGDIAAMIKVGNALRNGNKRMAVKKDFPKGVEWLKKAADQGSLAAMRSLESGYRRAADADSYDYHGYSKDADYWSQRIRDITASQMTSTEIVLIGKGKKRIGRKTFANRADLVRVEIASSVQSIGCSAFENCTELESVVIPASVTAIEADAFRGCAKLRQIELPEGVSRIEERSFCDCVKLECVKLPDSLKEICSGAFSGCSSLKKIDFGAKLERIGDGAFHRCSSITEVQCPESLEVIGSDAFEACSGIVSVRFPKQIAKLGCDAFSGCNSLNEIDLPTVGSMGSSAFSCCASLHDVRFVGVVDAVGWSAFQGCVALTTVVLPDGLKTIERSAFEGCTSLREIKIPNSVERVESNCFEDCGNLEHFIGGQNAKYASGVFKGCGKLPDVITDGVLIYSASQSGFVRIPTGVVRIADYVFHQRVGITSVELPETLEAIGDDAFSECSGIQEISLPSGLREIGRSVFRGCTSLEKISLPPCIEEIHDSFCLGCKKLTTLTVSGQTERPGCCILPPSLVGVDGSALRGCAFKVITLPSSLVGLENFAFADNDELFEVEVQRMPSRVCYHVFGDCKNLKKVRVSYQTGYKDGDADLGLFSGCAIDEAVIPCYLESKIDKLFGEYVPQTLSLVYEDGSVRPLELAEKQDESDEDRAFFAEYGIHRSDIKYSYEAAYDVYMGCRMQSPAKESRSVVIPEKYKDGDARTLIAKIYTKGSSKTYSVRDRDSDLEWYSLQRDAKKSKFWPVFAALVAYKPDAKK